MKPEPIAFHCPRCAKRWDNVNAVQPADGFVIVYNQSEPRVCEFCSKEERAYREAAEYLYPADLTDRCMRVFDAGKQTDDFPKSRDWKAPVTADEYRADLDQLSGGGTFRQLVERLYPGMIKEKP